MCVLMNIGSALLMMTLAAMVLMRMMMMMLLLGDSQIYLFLCQLSNGNVSDEQRKDRLKFT